MKHSFSFKNKEASLEDDIEGLVEKGLEHKAKNTWCQYITMDTES